MASSSSLRSAYVVGSTWIVVFIVDCLSSYLLSVHSQEPSPEIKLAAIPKLIAWLLSFLAKFDVFSVLSFINCMIKNKITLHDVFFLFFVKFYSEELYTRKDQIDVCDIDW